MDIENGLGDLDAIMDALDHDEPEKALRMARAALEREAEDDPVLHFLAARALQDLDLAPAAVDELTRALEIDPDDEDYRTEMALALFRSCRFDEAAGHVDRLLEEGTANPDLHELKALLLERMGELDEADAHFARAAEISPEHFPMPVRTGRAEFENEVAEASRRLPEEFQKHLDGVAVTVEDLPSEEILLDGDPPMDPSELLGLFVGIPLPDRSFSGPGGELPPRILLFKRNLERSAADTEELCEQITVTLYHELAHYLGFDEEEMDGLDLA